MRCSGNKMNIGILLTGNMIGGGVKMPVRLASHLAAQHDVTLLYPAVPHYVTYHRLRPSRLVPRARFIAAQWLRHRGPLFFRADLDPRVKVHKYTLAPTAEDTRGFDALIYESVWQHYELTGLPPEGRKIHWSLADYLFCSGVTEGIDRIVNAYRSDDVVVAPSEITRRDLERYGVKVRAVIGGGVDPLFNAQGRTPSDAPSVLGYFQPAWWVKGGATLLQVMRRLRHEHPRLAISMLGHQASNIQDSGASICDRFYSRLTSAQVAGVLRQHDIFVYPSYSDGFPSPPLEAMACGCAVVATRVGAVPEYAQHERNALLCDPLDFDGMYAAVERLVLDADLRRRLAAQAAEDARQWTWARAAEGFSGLLKTLATDTHR
jgi:glycosyltransferase involved in cell wall biosynthesis